MTVFCDKCSQDDEKTEATHACPTCKLNFCEGHLSFHNSSAKTKDHASQVKSLNSNNCSHCEKFHGETWPAQYECAECGGVKLCDLHKKIHDRSPKLSQHKVSMVGCKSVPFSGEFKKVCKLGDKDETNINLDYPMTCAVDVKNQLIFVACHYTINVFDAKTHLFKYQFKAPKEETITCLRIDYNDNAIVFCNSRKWVTKMSLDGKVVFWNKSFDNETGDLYLCVDSDSTVYLLVSEYRSANIRVLNGKDGSVTNTLGSDSNGNCLLSNATMVSIDLEGNLCIGDGTNKYQLVSMSKKGKVLNKLDRNHNYGRLGDIIHLDNGDIFCIEKTSGQCRIELITKESGVKICEKVDGKNFNGCDLAIAYNGQNGELVVASKENSAVYILK
ncbi:predicted protein [Naegleria gruberi]|uniref:Predicted protein n=1 Tax=Naegleria gruberi TaxID=5762 RepID=D2VGL0_NAEGR|nr:uncharacterized protein NAEGRDRAFT_68017 [Naegleria gruberi]EFC44083.1 predicted protein [Naegleria gruberi]|eukprot:XP_002676827.1 predicted protein [Naegleria gruberi strain NEG-M]